MTPSLDNLLLVMAVAFAAPLVLGLFPRLQLPSVVLEIVAGIVIGPSLLGWAEVDQAVQVVALLGLAFVLFLAGLEIEFEKLRGPVLRLTGLAFALSFGIAVLVSLGLAAGGLVETPLLVAIILCATSLGVLIPVLKDAGEISTTFGQLVIAACSIADFGAIISLLDRDEVMTHPEFRHKLEATGFGFFVPVFFVTSGIRYDADALFA